MITRNVNILIVLLLLVSACRNPFLPPTGVPIDNTGPLRATPQGVITQLVDAYENRQIDLYQDLFPTDGSFKFYVAPAFVEKYKERYTEPSEPGDSLMQFVSQSDRYYYWTQEVEVANTKRLFSGALSIEFSSKPSIQNLRRFVADGDSLAEMNVGGGILKIGVYLDINTIKIYSVYIDDQIFLLAKNEKGLWVIRKWYDFSAEKDINE